MSKLSGNKEINRYIELSGYINQNKKYTPFLIQGLVIKIPNIIVTLLWHFFCLRHNIQSNWDIKILKTPEFLEWKAEQNAYLKHSDYSYGTLNVKLVKKYHFNGFNFQISKIELLCNKNGVLWSIFFNLNRPSIKPDI